MYEHKALRCLDDYFKEAKSRNDGEVYFYRINGYDDTIKDFIRRYYEAARKSGTVIEGKIRNPDEKNLDYYTEIMGMNFRLSPGFLTSSLMKWLPRIDETQRSDMALAIYDTLDVMRREGKNENMLRNGYIKFMCWLYYQFENVVSQLSQNIIPKILYEGEIGTYELKLFSILSKVGCDVVFLQYKGDEAYLKLDPDSKLSLPYSLPDMTPFPEYFNIKWLRGEIDKEWQIQKLYGILPKTMNCTNAWMEGTIYSNILKPVPLRGRDLGLYYNCFCRMNGAEDKLTYLNELYQFQLQLKNNKRRVIIVEHSIVPPSNDEIFAIERGNYFNQEQMIAGLSRNIQYAANIEIQRLMSKAFIDIMVEEGKNSDLSLNKLTAQAVYLICWLKRYQSDLFSNWKTGEVSCFIHFGGCKSSNEALFLRLLARLPADVLILCPDLNDRCCLTDALLYEQNDTTSFVVKQFPHENVNLQIGTAAYHAERELDEIMYQDSGMYRNHQYQKAVSISLQTMYEEIALLWKEELKYRPSFSVIDDTVNLPVIFSKISGVKDGLVQEYWSEIKQLLDEEDTFLISKVPFIKPTEANPLKAFATEFFKNGKVQKAKIMTHSAYPYGVLRKEMQEHLLSKLQVLIDQKLIAGTFETGMEYHIIATALNLNKEIIRMVQRFDFTKKNPKIIYINTTDNPISAEDSILTAFLNLAGFDVVFFVPTGYQTVERYFTRNVMEEHQIGEYQYDMRIPDFHTFRTTPADTFRTWREKIFKRGN